MEKGLTFIDTAEVYGFGKSEEFLGVSKDTITYTHMYVYTHLKVALHIALHIRLYVPHVPVYVRCTCVCVCVCVCIKCVCVCVCVCVAGEFIKELPAGSPKVQVATKFAPLPWRLTADSVPAALKASLSRLQMSKVELYMQHWWVACTHIHTHTEKQCGAFLIGTPAIWYTCTRA